MSMTNSNSIRGTKVGSGPAGDVIRGKLAPSQDVSYFCANAHETMVAFATGPDVEIPEQWTCTRCGFDAGLDPDEPPAPPTTEVFKSHLDYVKERRSDRVGAELLEEALANLRDCRGN